jgi:hypothetical protein
MAIVHQERQAVVGCEIAGLCVAGYPGTRHVIITPEPRPPDAGRQPVPKPSLEAVAIGMNAASFW